MRRGVLAIVAVAGALAIGCHSDSSGPPGPFGGHWLGTDANLTLDITLRDDGGSVTGSGSLSGAAITGGSVSLTVNGSGNSSSCNFTVNAAGYTHLTMYATLADNATMQADLNGSGFSNYGLDLYKQPK